MYYMLPIYMAFPYACDHMTVRMYNCCLYLSYRSVCGPCFKAQGPLALGRLPTLPTVKASTAIGKSFLKLQISWSLWAQNSIICVCDLMSKNSQHVTYKLCRVIMQQNSYCASYRPPLYVRSGITSENIKTHGSVSCGPRSRHAAPVSY